MVRGLVIRQSFMVLDAALVFLVVAMTAILVRHVLQVTPGAQTAQNAAAAEASRAAQFALDAGKRDEYAGIVASGLFGDAGRWNPETPPKVEAPPIIDEDLIDTELNLRLLGTIALSPEDPFASAFIENQDQRLTKGYELEEEVVEKVKLVEIRQREVYLLNERNTPATKERLRMDDEDTAAPAPPERVASAATGATDRIDLNRQEFIQELYVNYADLVTKVKPEMYRDASGKVLGVTSQNISQVSLARKLGLKDGDVLTMVNNDAIDSEQKIMELVQKNRDTNAFRINILRDGKPKVITYSLN